MSKGNRCMKRALKKGFAAILGLSLSVTGIPEIYGSSFSVLALGKEEKTDVMVIQNDSGTTIDNVIYMIPDGGGFPSYDIAKAVKEAGGLTYLNYDSFKGTKPTSKEMYMDDYLVASMTTRSADNGTTDSAAAGTALATGKKTNNSYTGLNPSGVPIANLTELCQLEGMATGLIATSYEYDATPAAFSAHAGSRDSYSQIIKQMMYQDLNIVLGGGINYTGYTSSGNSNTIKSLGYTLVGTESELASAAQKSYGDVSENMKVWGTFQADKHHMPYDIGYGKNYDGLDDGSGKTPTLAEMTKYSIDMLSKDEDGFFLMVEGSKIDYGNHHRMMTESTGEWIAFDEAFKVALDFAKEDGHTAIVVVPDHNTGLTATPSDMSAVVKKVQNGESTKDSTNLLDFSSYEGSGDSAHTSMNVGVWMYLPDGVSAMEGTSATALNSSNRGDYTVDNTDIAPYVASLLGTRTLQNATDELYINVTNQGSYSDGTFTFSDMDLKVTCDTDIIKYKGTTLDLKGQICPYVNGKMYVPKYLYTAINVEYKGPEAVHEEDITGSGTQSDPYIISSAAQFLTFTNAMLGGETYAGKYIKQTANIDMSNVAGYTGLEGADSIAFAGTYDGQGHTIKVNIETSSKAGFSIFPYTTGRIMNLGTTGKMKNTYESNGGCAGIARSIRDGASMVNCWSTVDLTADYEVAGIAFSVRGSGKLVNCYYKGVMAATYNYGATSVSSSDEGTATVENCYYQLENGSSDINITGSNKNKGTKANSFNASTLNSYQGTAVKTLGLESADQLCNFVDLTGYDFAFEGSIAKLTKLTYTYTCKDGSKKSVDLADYTEDKTGYEATIGDEMNPNIALTVGGTAFDGKGNEQITEGLVKLDSKGCGTGAVVVTTSVKTNYYETSSTSRYSILFSGPGSTEEDIEQTPNVAITMPPVVTATPEVKESSSPVPSITPTATVMVTASATATLEPAKETKQPEVVMTTAPATCTPVVTVTPIATATITPMATATAVTSSGVSADVATGNSISISNCDVINYNGSYIYTRKKIAPAIMVLHGNEVLKKGSDYSVSYASNKNVGTAKMVIRGMGNYSGTRTVTFKIKAKNIKKLKLKKVKAQTYTGKKVKPSIVLKYGTYTLKKKKEFTVTYKKNIKRGTATVYLKGKGNYTGQRKVTFKIK